MDEQDFREIANEQREKACYVNIGIYPTRVHVSFRVVHPGSVRTATLWHRTIERPAGKTHEECLEAALYRLAAAGADGSLTGPGFAAPA